MWTLPEDVPNQEDAMKMYWEVYADWEAGEYDPGTAEYQRFPLTLIRDVVRER